MFCKMHIYLQIFTSSSFHKNFFCRHVDWFTAIKCIGLTSIPAYRENQFMKSFFFLEISLFMQSDIIQSKLIILRRFLRSLLLKKERECFRKYVPNFTKYLSVVPITWTEVDLTVFLFIMLKGNFLAIYFTFDYNIACL
jgi:hypothetical protein